MTLYPPIRGTTLPTLEALASATKTMVVREVTDRPRNKFGDI
jgi:hypothetical protein